MTLNNNLSIWPWYRSLSEQHHRRQKADGVIYPLFIGNRQLHAFQFPVEKSGDQVTSFKLVNEKDASEIDLFSELNTGSSNGFQIIEYTQAEIEYDILMFASNLLLASSIPNGQYYGVMTRGGITFYSEVITICRDLSKLLKITYYHSEEILHEEGHISYSSPYRNFVYLDPLYEDSSYEKEGKAIKKAGRELEQEIISYKLHRFKFTLSEFLMDALRIVNHHDFIKIEYLGKTYTATSLKFDSSWNDYKDLLDVELEFRSGTIVRVVSKTSVPIGDFDQADYNESFEI